MGHDIDNKMFKMKQKISKRVWAIPMLNPNNKYLRIWDVITGLNIIFCTFYIPIDMVSK